MDKPLHIVLLIDYIGSGGAQRQLYMLGKELKQAGANVEVITYFPGDFFLPMFQEAGIPVETLISRSKVERVLNIRRAIRDRQPDLLISFLRTPNILAELSGLPTRRFKIIVSERNTDITGVTTRKKVRFFLHRLADAVVVNSHAQYAYLCKHAPELQEKLLVISNCVDLDAFQPVNNVEQSSPEGLRILVLGRIHPQKDPIGLGQALVLLRESRPEQKVTVDWYGEHNFFYDQTDTRRDSYLNELTSFIADHSLQDCFCLHPPQSNVDGLYHNADVFCLPSLYEGCSNVLGEAMACGLPILASRVGDNERMVVDGENGFLFHPSQPEELADAIKRFVQLGPRERLEMGRKSRMFVNENLSVKAFADAYQSLILKLTTNNQAASERL